jgi:hypothetical protein
MKKGNTEQGSLRNFNTGRELNVAPSGDAVLAMTL